MADTGDMWNDALTSMKNHLTVQQGTWEISDIYDYPAYMLALQLNTISLEIAPNTVSNIEQVGDGIHTLEQIVIIISIVSEYVVQQSQYTRLLTVSRGIIDYLLLNPLVDSLGQVISYGSLGISTIQAEGTDNHAMLMQLAVTMELRKHHT